MTFTSFSRCEKISGALRGKINGAAAAMAAEVAGGAKSGGNICSSAKLRFALSTKWGVGGDTYYRETK